MTGNTRAPLGSTSERKMDKGKRPPTDETPAEQTRETPENNPARNVESNDRDRMVGIGRANQQAGRQKS